MTPSDSALQRKLLLAAFQMPAVATLVSRKSSITNAFVNTLIPQIIPSLEEIARLEGHSGHILSLAFNPDGSLLASGGGDKEVKVWDVKTHEQKAAIGPHPAAITSLCWAGDHLFAASEDGTVGVGSESDLGRALPAAEDVLYSIAVTSDGKKIVGGGARP